MSERKAQVDRGYDPSTRTPTFSTFEHDCRNARTEHHDSREDE